MKSVGTFKGKKGKKSASSAQSVGLLKVKESAGRLCQSEMRLGETVLE